MPVHRCFSSGLCLHNLVGHEDNESEYVEVDPTGRYGRYKEVLGRGAFKTVYKAFDQEDGIEVAWNQVQVHDDLQDVDRLYSEVNLLKTLKHKNIIKFYHSWMDRKSNTINFITEIFTSGTLRQYRKRHRHVDIKAVKNWSRQILRGLLYLHSHDPPIIHRDLKCDNILINGNQGEVKIGDLGLATILQHAHPARSVIGTPEFMAPELYEEEYTELVDIYSFGMCLLEMVTAEYPYSECMNAAQIYKRVTSGKKPESLNKVKDPELCQFIKKCLATASERLPARELLMDPFLQCEGNRKAVESLPERIGKTNEKDDLSVFMGECNGESATVQISYKLKEMLPNFPDDSGDSCVSSVGVLKSDLTTDHLGSLNSTKNIPPPQLKEERARNVDFRVNGKRREDDTVFLRLRIADPEGQVRNIHFPFDVESDTALCVASEMVAELDLTDQDVTKIAEMIDAAILALVPEWKPGVAIDETYGDGETLVSSVVEDGLSSMVSVFDPSTTIYSEGVLEEDSSSVTRVVIPEAVSTLRVESTLYERIEEVTYQCHRSDFSVGVEQEECTVSSDLSVNSKEVDWGSTDASSSGASQLFNTSLSLTPMFEEDSSRTEVRRTNNTELAVAFNELVESKRKAECLNFPHKTWEGIVQGYPCLDYYGGSVLTLLPQKLEADICVHDVRDQNLQQCSSAPLSENECDDESQELSELALRHQQELRELQQKHEEALSELKNRWHRKKTLQSSELSNVNHQCGLLMPSHEFYNTMQETNHEDTYCLEACSFNFRVTETPLRMSRDLSQVGCARSMVTDRLISDDVQVFLRYDLGSMIDSMTSYDDLSSLGQATPRSTLKAVQWQEPNSAIDASVNVPSTDKILYSSQAAYSRDCKSSTLKTENLVKSEMGTLSIPFNAQTVEQVV